MKSTIEDIYRDNCPFGWESTFKKVEGAILHVSNVINDDVKRGVSVLPYPNNIFSAFHLTSLSNVRVVIFGQDPYNNMVNINGMMIPRAQGLSFSVDYNDVIPVSLRNIYTALQRSIEGFSIPNHGNLMEWCSQGVLMLNAALTVPEGVDKAPHISMWGAIIKQVLDDIAEQNPNCIYVIWGKPAKESIGHRIKGRYKLEWCHPAERSGGFSTCTHFYDINQIFLKLNQYPINWTITSM